ncbi:MAG: phosphopantetheine-binding protein, partial [Gammaproteobacteria bacterium]|nr:phosphopantetheine-binding protein [Gammaproteobacteria bacterium]
KKLAKIWAKVLRVKRVGVHNNFFKLGGHSLLAIQVALRIRQTFDVDMSLQTFLKVPTIAGLAEKLEEQIQGLTKETGRNSEIIVSPENAHRMLGL